MSIIFADGVTEALRKLKVEVDSTEANRCLDCLLRALQEDGKIHVHVPA